MGSTHNPSKDLQVGQKLATVKPNIDCTVCDKAHFKTGSFKRNPIDDNPVDPPFWKV